MADVAAIARGLSKAQREAVLAPTRTMQASTWEWYPRLPDWTVKALWRRDLAIHDTNPTAHTMTSVAVRQYLQENPDG